MKSVRPVAGKIQAERESRDLVKERQRQAACQSEGVCDRRGLSVLWQCEIKEG